MFDASCLCTKTGALVASTPALDEFLQKGPATVSKGRPDSLLSLVDDMMRLLSFPSGTQHDTGRPTQLPVTLRVPNGPSLEATLYCVAVDDAHTLYFVAVRVMGRPLTGHTIVEDQVLSGLASEPHVHCDAASPDYQKWCQL